jgi:hypothetical protein
MTRSFVTSSDGIGRQLPESVMPMERDILLAYAANLGRARGSLQIVMGLASAAVAHDADPTALNRALNDIYKVAFDGHEDSGQI